MAITASAGVTILVLSALQLVCCVNSRQTGLWEPRLIEDWTGPGVSLLIFQNLTPASNACAKQSEYKLKMSATCSASVCAALEHVSTGNPALVINGHRSH